ncbi:MAG: aminotransferase class I/II-fold pyridoxal phosphate-dependent enzyme [Candidatus Omnitrophica bacterium]|nr:aminotransferase class I/II-fold pyridoxal phosphate-dependent enzyme [Candidatus Omnitrophota bacterium]
MALSRKLPAICGGFPTRKRFLPFHRPSLDRREERAVCAVLRSGWLTTGPKTHEFEDRIKNYLGARYVKAVNSCTAGLHLGLLCAEVGPGDEVITSPLTFASTGNVIQYQRARPVFADVDPDTGALDAAHVRRALTAKTKAVVPVHYAGIPADIAAIRRAVRGRPVRVVEDAAHAFGAADRGEKIGRNSYFAAYSFYATKNLTTGEGGAIATRSKSVAQRVECLRLHGLSHHAWKRYLDKNFKYRGLEVKELGYKYNCSDVQAALGCVQLEKYPRFLAARRRIAQWYDAAFRESEWVRPLTHPFSSTRRSAYHLYVVKLCLEKLKITRDQFVQALQKENIGASVHFKALHFHSWYRKRFGLPPGSCPAGEDLSSRVVSLPLYPDMRRSDVQDAAAAVQKLGCYFHRKR